VRGRAIAGTLLASVMLAASVTGCAPTTSGSARYSGETDSATAPLVKNDALAPLIPTGAQIAELIGRPNLVVKTTYAALQQLPDIAVSDPKCFGVIYATTEYEYRGSGYHAAFGMLADDPDTVFAPDVVAGVTSFDDADAARHFVYGETAKWRHCANRPLQDTDLKSGAAITWVAGPPAVADGVQTVTRTLEGLQGFGCTHALGARSNVVVDVDVCAPDATVTPGLAATLVNMVSDKITH
jgi:serine/threonine kinase PknH